MGFTWDWFSSKALIFIPWKIQNTQTLSHCESKTQQKKQQQTNSNCFMQRHGKRVEMQCSFSTVQIMQSTSAALKWTCAHVDADMQTRKETSTATANQARQIACSLLVARQIVAGPLPFYCYNNCILIILQ